MKEKLFTKDFTLVVIGQIISIFGNQIIRYALPIYLLNKTGSASLYGLVMALSLIPMIILSPIGGTIADRVNKRNVMVVLDFFTALLIFSYMLVKNQFVFVPTIVGVLMLLYGIQGAYQPAVQGALPLLVSKENLTQANSLVNGISSLAGIIGPALGGVFLASFGLNSILIIGALCFLFSAIMELFIHIPFQRRKDDKNPIQIFVSDMKESIHFISNKHPEIGKVVFICVFINFFLSSLLVIGFPVIIGQHLGFSGAIVLKLQGYCEASFAIGGLLGALLSGLLAKRIKLKHISFCLFLSCVMLLPIGILLTLGLKGIPGFIILVASALIMMPFTTIFNIQLISYLQIAAPATMISKLMALVNCLCTCVFPLGQLMYGYLFENLNSHIDLLFYAVFVIACLLCYECKKVIDYVCISEQETVLA